MTLKRQLLVTILAWLALGVFLACTEPAGLPVVGVIIPFVLLFAALFQSWRFFVGLRLRYHARGRPHAYAGAAVCGSIVLLLVLQSIGQLGVRDVVTVGAIEVLGYVYAVRMRADVQRPSG